MSATNQREVQTLSSDSLGDAWQRYFEERWPLYEAWYQSDGEAARPSFMACRRAIRQHMPEWLAVYEAAVELAGGHDFAARCLSGYRPPAYIAGCSQAIFRQQPRAPILVRNYDFSPRLWEGVIVRSRWAKRTVLGMSDCLMGLLDGINDAGLAVSLAFGGRQVVGDGFGMPHIVRYVLEQCASTQEAVLKLSNIPSHMAYNVSVLDRAGQHATVLVSPDRPASVTTRRAITNHQHRVEWPRHAVATRSVDRLRALSRHVIEPTETEARFVRRFLEPPVFADQHARGIGTLYTAVYRPELLSASYLWPRQRMDCGLSGPLPPSLTVTYGQTAIDAR